MTLTTTTILFFVIFFLGTVFVDSAPAGDCATSWTEGTDYFPDKVSVDFLSGFNVSYHNYYKIVTNIRANETYLLYCTSARPNISLTDTNVKSYVQVPVKNVASLDLNVVSFLEILGLNSSIQYIADPENVTSPCIQKANITSFVDTGDNNNNASDSVNVVFSSVSKNLDKYVTVPLGNDLNPLQKAEWIKFVSLFYNSEKNATDKFNNIQKNYDCNAQNSDTVPTSFKYTIAWVAYDSAANEWNVKNDIYFAQLTLNAGAIPISSSSQNFSQLSSFQSAISNAYLVIDLSPITDETTNTYNKWLKVFGYSNNDRSKLPAFIDNRRVYRTDKLLNKLGYDDWSRSSSIRPDLVLRDLISIQYPTYERDYVPTWLENFSASDNPKILAAENCGVSSAVQSPLFAPISTCDASGSFLVGKTQQPSQNNEDANSPSPSKKTKELTAIVLGSIGALLLVVIGFAFILRKKFQSKFIEMKDEPTIQMTQTEGEIRVIKVEENA
ncbi:10562_t:CDS:2 [Ambispora leptoticha]|uniref:10562_t:CDS:1 n=1 Tax=Ambispora leptoticha TaxID=144679 RepID=A0A9N9AIP5_9GLOM|nr:10562_t:CDS:2 [Ambispora leptoticha]